MRIYWWESIYRRSIRLEGCRQVPAWSSVKVERRTIRSIFARCSRCTFPLNRNLVFRIVCWIIFENYFLSIFRIETFWIDTWRWQNWQRCELCQGRWSSFRLWIWGLSFRRESWRVWQKWWNSRWGLSWWTGLSHFLLLARPVYLFCSIFSMILPGFVLCMRGEDW